MLTGDLNYYNFATKHKTNYQFMNKNVVGRRCRDVYFVTLKFVTMSVNFL